MTAPVTLSLSVALTLARINAPGVAPDTLVTFAQLESGLNPLALHDNATGISYAPANKAEAAALADSLILGSRHSVDLGLMQVNFPGRSREDLTIQEAFEPDRSMRAGGAILSAAYGRCAMRDRAPAEALKCAASLYNAGAITPAGAAYAARLWRTAEHVVPSIGKLLAAGPAGEGTTMPADPPPRDIVARPGGGRPETDFAPGKEYPR